MVDRANDSPADLHEAIRTLLFAVHAAQQLTAEIKQGKPGNLLKRQFDESVKSLLRAAHRVSGITPDALQVFADRMPAEWQDRVESSWHRLAQKQCLEKTADLCRVIYRNATAAIDESAAWPMPGDESFPEVLREYAEQAGKHAEVVARQWTASPLFPLVDVKRLSDAIRVELERAASQPNKGETLPPSPYGPPPIVVSLQAGTITVDGKTITTTPDVCKIVERLLEAQGDSVTWRELEELSGMRGKNCDRTMKAVRKVIDAHLKSDRTGYRITFDNLG